MGSNYLDGVDAPNLADVCRRATARYGTQTVEVGGRSTVGDSWKRRSRSSGGYDSGKPNHVIVHHTAGDSEGWKLSNYLTFDHTDEPCANLALMSNGDIYVQAGGASNHAGKGTDPCSPDVTAQDCMNSQSIGIEASNLGNGETWPTVQLDVYVALVAELCLAYAIPVARVHAHREWAPDRKIDPAGPPRYAQGSRSWDMNAFRADVQDYIDAGGSTPPPPSGGKVMVTVELPVLRKGDSGTDVARMQGLLVAAGWAGADLITGVWNDLTDTVVLNFQTAVGLGDPNDTSVGAKSWESLLTGRIW